METDLQVPTALNGILTPRMRPAVERSFTTFSRMLKLSKPPFFPEYTDHGPKHIQDVLNSAVELIPEEVFDVLTEEDACALCLAVLLHDLAMHFTVDGFLSLVKGETHLSPVPGLDKKDWPARWRDFKLEASRFSGRQNIAITGDPDPVSLEINPANLTDKQKYLVGEFLRRNHPALAHQIAINGFPGVEPDSPLFLHRDENVDINFLGLAGFIARSHGRSLWSCTDHLSNEYGKKIRPLNVTAVYLMVLLRIGDYIQLDSERAPIEYLRLKKLRSPISVREWKNHSPIRSVIIRSYESGDPECMELDIPKPIESLDVYLAIQRLQNGLQNELDKSWAVMGKLYANQFSGNLNKLGIKPRRVHSPLHETNYLQKLDFFPFESKFDVANTDIIKKLIEPLYGERPQVGVRELLQNAIDAIHERKHAFPLTNSKMDEWKVEISIKQDRDEYWFQINDDGIGMTFDVLRDYFLKAGATYRESEAWKSGFQTDNRESKVPRTGRFGVGSLAAFLIGEEIQLTTKHANGDKAITFAAKVDDALITLKPAMRQNPGTEIRIEITKEVFDLLSDVASWDWYLLNSPKVDQKINGEVTKRDPSSVFPSSTDKDMDEWRHLNQTTYESYHWTYSKAPSLTCNGIVVAKLLQSESDSALEWSSSRAIPYRVPNIAIFDKDGKLPLDLQRFGLKKNICPESESLLRGVVFDHLGFLVSNSPSSFPKPADGILVDGFNGLDTTNDFLSKLKCPYAFKKNGSVFANSCFFEAAGLKRILLIVAMKDVGGSASWASLPDNFSQLINEDVGVVFAETNEVAQLVPLALGKLDIQLNLEGCRVCVGRTKLNAKTFIEQASGIQLKTHKTIPDGKSFQYGTCKDESFDFDNAFANKSTLNDFAFIELFPNYAATASPDSMYGILRSELTVSPLFDYDLEERKKSAAMNLPAVSNCAIRWL